MNVRATIYQRSTEDHFLSTRSRVLRRYDVRQKKPGMERNRDATVWCVRGFGISTRTVSGFRESAI